MQNETARVFENSKIQIAEKEFKIIKLENLKYEDTDIINISDSDSEEMETDATNEIMEKNEKIKDFENSYEWKKKRAHQLIINSTNNLSDSDDEDDKTSILRELLLSQIKKEPMNESKKE